MKFKIVIAIIVLIFSVNCFAQENSIAKARKANIVKLLNYRYKGGYYTFEKAFNKNIVYPEVAKQNCIMGIALVQVTVDCEGVITKLKVKNPLGYGIENAISLFFKSTEGQWNTCKDDKYTSFEIPMQFVIKNTQTNTVDAMLVCEGENEGHVCNDDDYYIKRIEKYSKKGNNKKLLQYLSIMLCRDPYNSKYYDLRSEILSGGK